MQPIVFICGHRKSGTSMFHNLFDGHSHFSVYPVDLNVLYAYFPQYTAAKCERSVLERRLDKVVFEDLKRIELLHDMFDHKGFKSRFDSLVMGRDLSDMRNVISGLLCAYKEVHEEDKRISYFLAKETSIEIYARGISEWFPDARFIHLVRDPRDNYAAIKSGLNAKYEGYGDSKNTLLFSMLVRGLFGSRTALLNQDCLGGARYKVLRFEDLVSEPVSILNGVCDWLNVPYEESLLVPSVCGRLNSGNNFESIKFSGISGKNVGRWAERIEPREAALIEAVYGDEMSRFGYELVSSKVDRLEGLSEFYKWVNYKYFYHDRFDVG